MNKFYGLIFLFNTTITLCMEKSEVQIVNLPDKAQTFEIRSRDDGDILPIEDGEFNPANDPYVFTQIFNMFLYGKPGFSEDDDTLDKVSKKWQLQTQLYSPEQIFLAYIERNKIIPMWDGEKTLNVNLIEQNIDTLEKFSEKYPEFAEKIFSYKYFGIPTGYEQKKQKFLSNGLSYLDPQLIKSIYTCAKRILELSKSGDYIVIFGNTPFFIGAALQELAQSSRNIIIFPFSGSPNRTRPKNYFDSKDIVTTENLAHLQERIKKIGLTPKNKNLKGHSIYFVDVIASGSGPAFMIEEILRDFNKANEELPNLSIIALNEFNVNDESDPRNAMIAEQNAKDDENLTLYFPTVKDVHFTIGAKVIFLNGHGLLDNIVHDDLRMLPKYNAAYWLPKYDYLLNEPLTRLQEILLEYFKINLIDLIEKDKASLHC